MHFFSEQNLGNLAKKGLISVMLVAALPVVPGITAAGLAATKGKATAKAKPKSMKPIDTVGDLNRPQAAIDAEGIKWNLESRLARFWRGTSIGPSKMCEVHFYLLGTGGYSDAHIWRSSGDGGLDQVAVSCIDQAGPYGMFDSVERIACVATFRREPKGGDVTVTLPGLQGADSSFLERQVAAKKTQQMNTIKIMKERIVNAQKVLGTDSPKLSESINFLANTYKDVGNWSSAEGAFKWAISIREKANGANSKEVAESYSDLGDMYVQKGDKDSAEDCFKRVINTPDMKPCPGLYSAMQRYAKLCLKTGREKDSTFLYKRLTDLQEGKPMAPLPDYMVMDTTKKADAETPDASKPVDTTKAPDAAKPADK